MCKIPCLNLETIRGEIFILSKFAFKLLQKRGRDGELHFKSQMCLNFFHHLELKDYFEDMEVDFMFRHIENTSHSFLS